MIYINLFSSDVINWLLNFVQSHYIRSIYITISKIKGSFLKRNEARVCNCNNVNRTSSSRKIISFKLYFCYLSKSCFSYPVCIA
jgi:hypothetical protein